MRIRPQGLGRSIGWRLFQAAIIATVVWLYVAEITPGRHAGGAILIGITLAIALTWSLSLLVDFARVLSRRIAATAGIITALVITALTLSVHPADLAPAHLLIYAGTPLALIAVAIFWLADILDRRIFGAPRPPLIRIHADPLSARPPARAAADRAPAARPAISRWG